MYVVLWMYVISFSANLSCVFCRYCVCLLLFPMIILLVWANEDACVEKPLVDEESTFW